MAMKKGIASDFQHRIVSRAHHSMSFPLGLQFVGWKFHRQFLEVFDWWPPYRDHRGQDWRPANVGRVALVHEGRVGLFRLAESAIQCVVQDIVTAVVQRVDVTELFGQRFKMVVMNTEAASHSETQRHAILQDRTRASLSVTSCIILLSLPAVRNLLFLQLIKQYWLWRQEARNKVTRQFDILHFSLLKEKSRLWMTLAVWLRARLQSSRIRKC